MKTSDWEEIININKYTDRDWENEIAETLNWFRFTRLSSAYGLNEHNQKVYSCRLKKKNESDQKQTNIDQFCDIFSKKKYLNLFIKITNERKPTDLCCVENKSKITSENLKQKQPTCKKFKFSKTIES